MWIRSEDGQLYNLQGAHSIQSEDRGGGQFVVVAEYSPTDVRSYNLTARIPKQKAEAILAEITGALEEGRPLLNLQRED